jgi:general L-amino acid transport system permease protein
MSERSSAFDTLAHQPVPLWRDIRVLQLAAQIVFTVVAVAVGLALLNNMLTALTDAGITPNADFLQRVAGFELGEGPEFGRSDSFADAFRVGLTNTLRAVSIGLVLATVLGVIMGVARLSTNWLVKNIARVYVDIMQNTPLLVQLYFIYLGVFLALPSLRDGPLELPGAVFLSNRGLVMPALIPSETFSLWLLYAVVGVVTAGFLWYVRTQHQERTGRPGHRLSFAVIALVFFAVLGWMAVGEPPISLDLPQPELRELPSGEMTVRRINGGDTLTPEFSALLTGLVIYTGAFIAEVVRAGIQAVPYGQVEAARAQGLSYFQTLQLIVLPQALRIIIPPLGNQYLNLAKNSSLAIAIGFPDVFSVSNTISNQSGQALTMLVLIMITYLTISLTISAVMNWVNRRMQIKER